MKHRVVINTHRYGDILNALPIAKHWHDQGDRVSWVVHRNFAGVFDGVSYVRPVIFDGDMSDGCDAERLARIKCPDGEIIHLQPSGNPVPARVSTSRFSTDPWARAELLERFHQLPLVIDRRDAERDRQTVADYWKHNGRPVVALCLKGHSSAWNDRDASDFRCWLVGHVRQTLGWDVVGIGSLQLPHFLDLLPLLEQAAALVSIDTAPIHLAYASMTPTIVLSRSEEWGKSEPRRHWLGQFTYGQAMTAEARHQIAELLAGDLKPGRCCRPVSKMVVRPIIHVYQEYESASPDARRRNAAASGSWQILSDIDRGWRRLPFRTRPETRTALEIDDLRDCPYIRDLVDFAASKTKPSDVICYTNTDIALIPDAGDIIREKMAGTPCCFSSRAEVGRIVQQESRETLRRFQTHPEVDLFAFTVEWWKAHRENFPDCVLGYEGWDWVLRWMMLREYPAARIDPPIVYHERHEELWKTKFANEPGNRLNRKLCRAWAKSHGCEAALLPDPDLFKADEHWSYHG